MMSDTIMSNVSFSFHKEKKNVLNDLSFKISPGEIVGLLGANGAGKTTIFRLLAGLLLPDHGEIKIGGISVSNNLKKALKTCAYLPDESLLYQNFSALENMNLFSILWGVEKGITKSKTESLFKEVGLWDYRNQWVESYSKGMVQKLSICTALLHDPKVMLLDEPFTGLDIDSNLWARRMFRNYIEENKSTILFTSHTPEVIESLATRVLILDEGRIVQDHNINSDSSLVEIYKQFVSKKKS